MIGNRFEWADDKEAMNLAKHDLAFAVAAEVFRDPLLITIPDPDHSIGEVRFLTIGDSLFNGILVVCHTPREERVRIIHARRATRSEKRRFMNKEFEEIRDDEIRPEYDFSGGVRGMFYIGRTTILMRIEEDVARYFPTAESINHPLRQLIAEGRAPQPT